MSKTIHLGIVGCGNWGMKLFSIFNSMENVTIVGCSDSNRMLLNKLSKKYPHLIFHESYQVILSNPKIDSVIIATSPDTHFDIVRSALEHGKHVFVEKPFVLSSMQAKKILLAVKKYKKIVMVDHTFMYSSDIRKLKNILDTGVLGKLLHVEMSWASLGLFSNEVDVIWDLAPHPLSILLFLLDKYPSMISCNSSAHIDKKNIDTAHISFLWENGPTANVFLSWLYPLKVRQVILIGTKAMAIYGEEKNQSSVTVYDKNVLRNPPLLKNNLSTFTYRDANSTDCSSHSTTKPLNAACKNFIECIQSGDNPISDSKNGFNVVRMIEYVHNSLV